MKKITTKTEIREVMNTIYEVKGIEQGTVNMWFRDNEPYLEFLDSKTKDSAKDAAYAAIRNAFKFEIEDDF